MSGICRKALLKTAPRTSTSTTTASETGRHATTLTGSRHNSDGLPPPEAQAHRAGCHRPQCAALLAHMLSIHIAIAVDLATRRRQSCPPLKIANAQQQRPPRPLSSTVKDPLPLFGVSHSYPFHVSIRQSVAQVPTHRQHDDLMGEPGTRRNQTSVLEQDDGASPHPARAREPPTQLSHPATSRWSQRPCEGGTIGDHVEFCWQDLIFRRSGPARGRYAYLGTARATTTATT